MLIVWSDNNLILNFYFRNIAINRNKTMHNSLNFNNNNSLTMAVVGSIIIFNKLSTQLSFNYNRNPENSRIVNKNCFFLKQKIFLIQITIKFTIITIIIMLKNNNSNNNRYHNNTILIITLLSIIIAAVTITQLIIIILIQITIHQHSNNNINNYDLLY